MDFLKDIYPSLLELAKIFVGAFVIFRFGREAYRGQKIHEEIREHYFKNGIDIISTEIREGMVSVRQNYEIALRVLGLLKDVIEIPLLKITFDDLFKRQADYPPHLCMAGIYKLKAIIGPEKIKPFHRAIEFFYTDLSTANSFFIHQIRLVVDTYFNDPSFGPNVKENAIRLIGVVSTELKKLEVYNSLYAQVEQMSLYMRKKRINNYNDLSKLGNDKQINEYIEGIDALFKDRAV
jgi:hypothetical protein